MLYKRSWIIVFLGIFGSMSNLIAQISVKEGAWRGQLLRVDGRKITFHFDIRQEHAKTVLYVINASERLRVDKIRLTKDSVFIEMPVFESNFYAKRISDKHWEGVWIKGGSVKSQVMPFIAESQASFPTMRCDSTRRAACLKLSPHRGARPTWPKRTA